MLKLAVLLALAVFSPSVQSETSAHLRRLHHEVVNVNVHVAVGNKNERHWPSHPNHPRHHRRGHHMRRHHDRESDEKNPLPEWLREHGAEHHRPHHRRKHHSSPHRMNHRENEEHEDRDYSPEHKGREEMGEDDSHDKAAVAEVDDATSDQTSGDNQTQDNTQPQDTQQAPDQQAAPHHRKHHNFFSAISDFFGSGKASKLVDAIGGIFNVFHNNDNAASVAEINSAMDADLLDHPDNVQTVETITNHLLFNVDRKLLLDPEDSDEAETAYLQRDYSAFEWRVLKEAQNDPEITNLESEIHEAWLNGEKDKLTSLKTALHEVLAKVEDMKLQNH